MSFWKIRSWSEDVSGTNFKKEFIRAHASSGSKNFDTEADWNITTEKNPSAHNRQVKVSRGKFLGGSSGVNGTLCIRVSTHRRRLPSVTDIGRDQSKTTMIGTCQDGVAMKFIDT